MPVPVSKCSQSTLREDLLQESAGEEKTIMVGESSKTVKTVRVLWFFLLCLLLASNNLLFRYCSGFDNS